MPSLDDLMSALGDIEEPRGGARVAGHLHQLVQRAARHGRLRGNDLAGAGVPGKIRDDGRSRPSTEAPVTRVLVLLDPERPIKYPLFKETMTIGRADIADIHINNGFLSRLHARVVSTPSGVAIEDIESKNGIRVNAKLVTRQALRHGDVIDLGRLRFRFIDTAADDAD